MGCPHQDLVEGVARKNKGGEGQSFPATMFQRGRAVAFPLFVQKLTPSETMNAPPLNELASAPGSGPPTPGWMPEKFPGKSVSV